MPTMPGTRVLPRPSTVRAPSGIGVRDDGPLASTRPSFTTTVQSRFGAEPSPSMTVTCAMANTVSENAVNDVVAALLVSCNAKRAAIDNSAMRSFMDKRLSPVGVAHLRAGAVFSHRLDGTISQRIL